jgi:ketosteroid isomerase-like protein
MKQIIFVASVFLTSCANQQIKEDVPVANQSAVLKKIVDEKNTQVETWYRTGNLDSLCTIFADNVVQMPPNQPPIIGIENFRKSWAQSFQFGKWNFELETQEVKANGDLGVELGKYTLSFEPNPGSPIPPIKDTGNYVVHWEKINNVWKAVWDAPVSTVAMH